jgi:hypothetical protein
MEGFLMKKRLLIIVGLLIFSGVVWKGWGQSDQTREQIKSVVMESEPAVDEGQVELVVDFSEGEVATFSAVIEQGATVLSVLKGVLLGEGVGLEAKEYDFGVLVEAIGGRENSQDRAWIYFVNGQAGEVAADRKEVVGGDVVEWKYIEPVY